ncbi:MAG: HPr kinase/phosphorylase [Hyphomicrobiales bacterium]
MIASIHASCVVVGERGVLIRGKSGSGKTTLARRLINFAMQNGIFARLVGDDRIFVAGNGGRLIASGHPDIAGMVEVRGVGILKLPYESACVVRLVVDCSDQVRLRSPEEDDCLVTIQGIRLPRIETTAADGHLVLSFLGHTGQEAVKRLVE